MKKNTLFTSIIIVTTVLLSSCGANMSITKRHYNNGYYVSNTKMPSKEKQRGIEKWAQTKTNESPNFAHNKSEDNAINIDSAESLIIDNNVMVASNNKIEGSTNSRNIIKHAIKQQAKILTHATEQNKHTSFRKNKLSDDSDDPLSLLWIVIVAILILWVLGLLTGGFGLGGLFHLLLLIAVILLVLWLLRIL